MTTLRSSGLPNLSDKFNAVNRLLCHGLPSSHFATFIGVEWQESSGKVCIINAGHPAPVIIRKNGSITFMEVESQPAIGVFSDHDFQVEECRLAKGDRLLLYSDGLSEARNSRGEMFDTHLVRDIKNLLKDGKGDLLESLKKRLNHFMGSSKPDDDITVLLLDKLK